MRNYLFRPQKSSGYNKIIFIGIQYKQGQIGKNCLGKISITSPRISSL